MMKISFGRKSREHRTKKIPDVAEPRGDMGDVSPEPAVLCFYCDFCNLTTSILETSGPHKKSWHWRGPHHVTELGDGGVHSAVSSDLRVNKLSCTDYDLLLRNHILAGNYPTCIPETHRGVITAIEEPTAVQSSLSRLGQAIHNVYATGTGDYNIDEYSIILERLPWGYSKPIDFLLGYLRNPNKMANSQWSASNPINFDTLAKFQLKEAGTQANIDSVRDPEVGDWYHIRIPGNNGDVMIVDVQVASDRCSATVATMTDQEIPGVSDLHPVSGRRQFGVETLTDGSMRFYSRGFDRQSTVLMDLQVSNIAQHQTFSCLMEAMAHQHGGRAERFDDQGDPLWGWCRQVPVGVLLSSVVVVQPKVRVENCFTGLAISLRNFRSQVKRRFRRVKREEA